MFWSYAFLFNRYRTFRQASDMRCLFVCYGPLFDFPATLFLHFMYILFTLCVHFNIGHEYGAVQCNAPFKSSYMKSRGVKYHPWSLLIPEEVSIRVLVNFQDH